MCTLLVAYRQFSDWPLVVAANRDERLDRPSSPIQLRTEPRCVAPRDELALGTWLGLNPHGLFVGITNRFGVPKDERRESRGKLVVEALRAPSALALNESLRALPSERYNAFHLLYVDAGAAFVTWSDGSTVRSKALPAGMHIVTERSLGGDDRARTELLRSRWAPRASSPVAPPPAALEELLALHADDPLGGVCVHAPDFNYGTRSSMVLYLGARVGDARLYWAEGSPCTSPFRDRTVLLRELAG